MGGKSALLNSLQDQGVCVPLSDYQGWEGLQLQF